jgi:hypothetical protein
MANSYIEYNQNLSETTYSVPFNVLSIDDVNVKGYDGTTWSDLTVSERDAVAKTVKLDGAPSAYQKIRVWRNTSATQLVDFQNGSRLSESDLDTAYQQGLFVAQEVSEGASTNIAGIGPQGPQGIQGIQGVAGNDGADGVEGVTSTVALTASFESSEIAIPSSDGFVTVTHGLGAVPKLYSVCLRCKTAEHGYAVGDEVNLGIANAYRTSTDVSVRGNASVTLYNKTTGVYGSTITNSNWKLVFRAFA